LHSFVNKSEGKMAFCMWQNAMETNWQNCHKIATFSALLGDSRCITVENAMGTKCARNFFPV
jgi:hypothetical protein